MLRICAAFVLISTAASGAEVRIIDGDTIEVGHERVRLFGIDAPEHSQTCKDAANKNWACGEWASDQLRQQIGDLAVTCTQRDTDRYGRIVATCSAGGRDVGRAMVRAGAAVAYRKYSLDYVRDEDAAKSAARGIWGGQFERPADYRHPVQVVSNTCTIKGNISGAGRIYHQIGQRDYDAVRISETKGERWFCSPSEAEAAGWRAAKR